MPGRSTASGVTVPACGPVSQYFDSRRPWSRRTPAPTRRRSASRRWRSTARRPRVSTVPSGSRRNRLPRAARLEDRARGMLVGERARRLGEIDCAVRQFGDIRAELQRPPSTSDTNVSNVPVPGSSASRPRGLLQTNNRPSRRDVQAQRPAADVGDDAGSPPSGGMRTILPSISRSICCPCRPRRRPRALAGHGDDGQIRPTGSPAADRPAAASSGQGRSAASRRRRSRARRTAG